MLSQNSVICSSSTVFQVASDQTTEVNLRPKMFSDTLNKTTSNLYTSPLAHLGKIEFLRYACNGYVENFNNRFRDELLNRELFYSLKEAKYLIEQFRLEYNNIRPHSSLNYLTPTEFMQKHQETTLN